MTRTADLAASHTSVLPMGRFPVPTAGLNPVLRWLEKAILFLMELQRRADEKAKMRDLPWHLINDAGIDFDELKADLKKPFWRFPLNQHEG